MSVDNPYYFYNESKSPKTPSDTSNKVFSFFKRRNSKGSSTSSNCSKASASNQIRSINSATLSTDATALLGSPRCSLGSLGSNSGTSFLQTFDTQNGNNTLNSLYRRPNCIQRERLGSFNESVTYHIENDDVFLQTTRSHKTKTLPESGNRRHSIGNLMNRNERQRCPSFSDEVPKMVAPKPPIISPTKYSTNNRRRDNCNENLNMDDILIITAKHSERALSWASFLRTRFDKITKQRDRKRFNFLYIKIDDGPISVELAQKCQTTALQIAILCPTLLALPPKYLMSQFSAILNQDKILAVLLDVSEEKVLEIHKSAFPSFRKWRRCIVRENDQSSIGNILGISTDILGRALCQRPPCQESISNVTHSKVHRLNSNSIEEFTVMPRKVKIGQSKVLALLNDPLTKDDSIKIIIEKTGEIIELKNFKQRNPYTLQFNIPETCMEISTMVEIRIEKNDKSIGSRPIKCESQLRELEQLLRTQDCPIEFMCHSLGIGSTERDLLDLHLLHCFQKNMPPNFHLFGGPFEQQNNFLSMRDCSPEEYPTLLHFAAKWGLERLCMQLVECPGGDTACEIKNIAGKTPADIAEFESFTKLSNSLKSFSQMHEFATMYHYFKGISDSTNTKVIIDVKSSQSPVPKITTKPSSSRQLNTHNIRAEKDMNIKNGTKIEAEYMEMSSGSETETQTNPTTLAITNLNYINIESKDDSNPQSSSDELSKKLDQIGPNDDADIMSNELKVTEPPYYQSNDKNKSTSDTSSIAADQFSQECSNLLDNCSVSSQSDYMLQPSNIPVEQNTIQKLSIQENLNKSTCLNYMNESITCTKEEPFQLKFCFDKHKHSEKIQKNGTLKRTSSDASSTKGNADDELAEIMYDFKNNVLSIREVEQLVEKWKNRNDVKQSFKEKQEQIEKLRGEYDKIQEKMKENMKRPTPFERVKKLFSRNKSSNKNIAIEIDNNETKSTNRSFQSNQRPISSLSLQSVSSSSSSGRMSTGSACSGTSLGDSGTHSDHEERRQLFGPNTCRIGSPGSLMDNYLVPPIPRPVSSEDNDRLVFSSNHYRVTTPTSQMSPTEHYILFPSNVPVFQDNQCGLNTIPETKEIQNDLTNGGTNNVTVTPIKIHNSYEKNIIYGKLHKNRPKELCSSFKTQFIQRPNDIIDCKKEMSDVYQNINGLDDDKKDKPKKFLSEEEINLSRESNCYNNNNNNNNNSTNNISFDNSDEHNYINI